MNTPDKHARCDWPRLWSAVPAAEVKRSAGIFSQECKVEDLILPQSGLGLLQWRDGALAENFYLGEIPMARAQVRVTDRNNHSGEGAAQLLDDRIGLVRAIAILDAVLASRLSGWERAEAMLADGARLIAELDAARRSLLINTRVDFSLLSNVEQEDEDE
jgi:alpha-D-ribose 1-methylphosphonate 5-triphosphate synthase subunit PhnG